MENDQKTILNSSSQQDEPTRTTSTSSDLNKGDFLEKLETADKFYYEGRYSSAKQVYQEILTELSKQEANLKLKPFKIYYKLGLACLESYDYVSASQFLSIAYDLGKSSINSNALEVANILIGLGRVYSAQGKYNEAASKYEESLEIIMKNAGPNAEELINLYNHYGKLKQAEGKYQEALRDLEEADRIISIYGSKHDVDLSYNYSTKAWTYYHIGNYIKAIKCASRSIGIREKMHGKDNHPEMALNHNCLGSVFINQGKIDKASESFTQALNIRLEFFGEDNLSTAVCYNNIGAVQRGAQNYDAALENFEKCLKARQRIFGDNHTDVATSYNNVGAAFHSKKQYQEALKNYNRCLEINIAIFGDNHPSLIMNLNNIGLVYQAQGNDDMALSQFKKGLSIGASHNLKNHPDAASFYYNIGLIYHKKKEFGNALSNAMKSLEITEALFGNSHLDVHFCQSLMMRIFDDVNDLVSAEGCLMKSRKTLLKTKGNDTYSNKQKGISFEKRTLSLNHTQNNLL